VAAAFYTRGPVEQDYPNPLLSAHEQAEAELQAYDRVPIVSTFGEPQAEYAAIRKGCGLMDLPQRGVLELSGRDRLDFVGNLVSNRTWDKASKSGLTPGEGAYAFLLNLRGRVVVDLNLLERGDRLLIETDVRCVELLRATFDKYLFTEQVKMRSLVGTMHELALHGPRGVEVLREASGSDLPDLPPHGSTTLTLFNCDAIVWRDDACGVPGLHLLVASDDARAVWMNLIARFGQSQDTGKRPLRQVGWAAFNAVRIEAGRPLVGIDIEMSPPSLPGQKAEPDAESKPGGMLPAETGLFERAVSVTKGCYLGQEIVARMHARQVVARRLVGLRVADDALPIAGAHVLDETGNPVGVLTSSTVSPVLSNASIGLAVVKKPHFEPGRKVRIAAEGAVRDATVVTLPFVT
jgi:aminomethyltransferase